MKTNQLIFVGEEETEGTLATTMNVLETVDGQQVGIYEGDRLVRNVDSVTATAGIEVNKSPNQTYGFAIDGAGSAAVGTSPIYTSLLKACGFTHTKDTTSGSEKDTFKLDSNAKSKTVSVKRYIGDKMMYETLGCRGVLALDFADFLKFNISQLRGSYSRPVEATFPDTINYKDYASPVPITEANTPICKLDGYDLVLQGGNINCGSGTSWIDVPNQKFSQHGELFTSGSATCLAPDLSTKNFFSKMESHNGVETLPFVMQHGTIGGNIIEISEVFQLSNVSETEVNSDLGYSFDLKGQGQFILTIR